MHHTTRPQHIRHHMGHHQQHQGPIHHQHPPPSATAVGMNMGPQQVGGPQQHHMGANVTTAPPPPHGSNPPIGQYIPPHQRNDLNRFSHHNPPRLPQQPMHQQSSQSKLRSNAVNHPNGLLATSSMPPPSQQGQHPQHHQQGQQQSQQSHPKQFHQGGAILPHQGGLSKNQGPLKHTGQPFPHKLSSSSPKKILSHLSHPPPNMGGNQIKPAQFQASNTSPITNGSTINLPSSKPQSNIQKHVTILTKPPPSIPQIPITQPPPQIPQSNAMSIPPPNVVSSTQMQQLQNVQEDSQQHSNIPSSTMQQQQLMEKQQVIQQQQQQKPLKSASAQLQSSHNISNQTTISSTTNSVLVSITHQQTQQTVVVQQQQQQAQAQQTARQGQPLENQSPIVSILQNNTAANKASFCENNVVSSNLTKEISSELNSSDVVSSLNDSLANNKEKTPMCLVNELARYNRIQHQYRLTSETGPAHAKRFTVTLKLGEEEYTAEGLSIKKAQHLAAADAISKTKYQHPPPKSHRLKNKLKAGVGTITPTVELNALAMKLGEPTIYLLDNQSIGDGNVHSNVRCLPSNVGAGQQHVVSSSPMAVAGGQQGPQQPPPYVPHQQTNAPNYFAPNQYQNFNRPNVPNGMYNSTRFPGYYPKRPFIKGPMKFAPNDRMIPYNNTKDPCRVTLVVGSRRFVGVGSSLQAARHDAATRALEVIKPLVNEETSDVSNDTSTEDANSDLKSPISLVHEIALKRNFSVVFEVVSERGPPHMKTFVTKCKVGDIVTEGEGNGKKLSKKRAAMCMLEELRKLPPVSPSRIVQTPAKLKAAQKQRKPQPVKRKSRNIIKEQSQGGEIEEEVNPISKLIQIQQALKEREPVYTVVEERGAPRRREFVIEVSASGRTARGIGTNKKMAKRLAAENLLALLGYNTSTSNVSKDITKLVNNNTTSNNNNIESINENSAQRVKYMENVDPKPAANVGSNNQGRQIVPGIILMQQQQLPQSQQQICGMVPTMKSTPVNGTKLESESAVSTTSSSSSGYSSGGARPKDQLLYLGQLLGFEVQYSDYPKGNHGAYLSIVTLSTDPPQLCHGSGNKIEESQDEASLTALRLLSELGLDNVKPKKSNPEEIKT